MALDSWLTKVKSTISTSIRSTMPSNSIPTVQKSNVGILAFEIATLMSKLLHLWHSLSDPNITRLREESIALEGIRKIVSDDDAFLLGLASAELTDTLRSVAESTSAILHRCTDPGLHRFGKYFTEFADSGHDPNRWVMTWREMEVKAKKMDRYVAATGKLYKEIDELAEAEHVLKKLLHGSGTCKIATVADAQQKILWLRQEVKHLKQTSLWSCSMDTVAALLTRSGFTVLARIKEVFVGVGHEPVPVPRSLSLVYPSSDAPKIGFFDSSSAMLAPPKSTLGASGLALHYANLIVVIDRMIRSPRAVGPEARDELYEMLPARLRGLLRMRLSGLGWGPARDVGLAMEWRAALGQIVGWLWPVAHNTIMWQGERSFERRSAATPRANVLLLQTLYFANQEKVEAAVAELLVGLNYVWRFEVAASAEVLMQSGSKCLD